MKWEASYLVAAAVIFGAYLIAKVIEEGLKRIAERIDSNGKALDRQLDRVGTKLDALWGPLKAISNAHWKRLGELPDEAERPE